MIFEAALIALFCLYIMFLLITNHKQNKKLLNENRDMNYVIQSLPKDVMNGDGRVLSVWNGKRIFLQRSFLPGKIFPMQKEKKLQNRMF